MFGGFFDDFMGDMMDPFGMMGRRNRQPNHPMAIMDTGFPGFGSPMNAMMPFGFPDIHGMMNQMQQAMRDPNAMMRTGAPGFVSTSVVQMSYDGSSGQPQIYQESSTTRQGPGGVRETRRTVTDTRSGTKKMSIGHHLDSRGRIIERSQDLTTRQMEENEELINLEEEEKDTFEREWQHRATMGQGGASGHRAIDAAGRPRPQRAEMLALPPAPSHHQQQHPSRGSHQRRGRTGTGSTGHLSHERRGARGLESEAVTQVQPGQRRPTIGGVRRHERHERSQHRRRNH